MKIDKKYYIITVLVVALFTCLIYFNTHKTKAETAKIYDVTETVSESSQANEEICVFVCGCVNNPGVYYLPISSRVCDAIELAGGISEDADVNFVNQAEPVSDGERICIPSIYETQDSGNSALVNINVAKKEQLLGLPGIGEARADAIIEYRKNNRFNTIEDIMKVSGIKDAAFNMIKDMICV